MIDRAHDEMIGYLGPSSSKMETRVLEAPNGHERISILAPTPTLVRHLLAALAGKGQRWRAVPLAERAATIAAAATRWRDPENPRRRMALALTAAWTGRAEGMLADSLDFFLGKLDCESLLEEAARCGLETRGTASETEPLPAPPPKLVLHWLAGNTPWAGLESISAAALAGSASMVKTARGDPVFAVLYARELASSHPALEESLAALYWDGARDTAHDPWLAQCVDTVVAFGSDDSVERLQNRLVSHAFAGRFIVHGHRLSLLLLGEEAWREETLAGTAGRVAIDHVLEDQTGCLSPRSVFLLGENGPGSGELAAKLAERIDAELKVWETRWPRAPIAPEAAARVQQLRDAARMRGANVWASPDSTAWTVVLDRETTAAGAFEPAPEARFVHLRLTGSLEETARALRPARGKVSTVGVDGFPDTDEISAWLVDLLALDRLCPAGTMQRPRLGWNHDGASDLALLLGTGTNPRTKESLEKR